MKVCNEPTPFSLTLTAQRTLEASGILKSTGPDKYNSVKLYRVLFGFIELNIPTTV